MCLQYKSFENTVGKGEIAHTEQFLLFQQCCLLVWRTFCHFLQTCNCCLQTLSDWKILKFVIWEKVKRLTLYHTIPPFNNPKEEGFGKHCGKRRKCWLPAFSPFPTMFSTLSKTEILILATFILLPANAFNLVSSNFLCGLVKG